MFLFGRTEKAAKKEEGAGRADQGQQEQDEDQQKPYEQLVLDSREVAVLLNALSGALVRGAFSWKEVNLVNGVYYKLSEHVKRYDNVFTVESKQVHVNNYKKR